MARVLISAGDWSGDKYAAALVDEMLRRNGEIQFAGLGGRHLAAAGADLWGRIDDMGAMGLVEVISAVPRHVSLLSRFKKKLKAKAFDLVVLVDYPDFNLRIARIARKAGVPVLYYVAPQLWAWRKRRARAIRRDVTTLAVIFPFEKDFFQTLGVPSRWVGHPLLEGLVSPERSVARKNLGIQEAATVVALLPGSRPHEIARLWPVFKEAAKLVHAEIPGAIFLVGADVGDLGQGFLSCDKDIPNMLAASDAAMCKSGTVSLETALAGVPMVIAYRMHPLSFAVARRMVRVENIGIVNLMMGETVVPEFVQNDATPANISAEILKVLRDQECSGRQLRAFEEVRSRLGESVASRNVASAAFELLP